MPLLIQARHPVRKKIASLSSGNGPHTYYDEVSHWWDKAVEILTEAGIPPMFGDCPSVYNEGGRATVSLHDTDTMLHWTWYRMPVSRRWEIVCYLTYGV